MDAELKAKWVKALRSGKYKQGKAALRDGDQYCCLGVLCEIQGADMGEVGFRSYPPAPFAAGIDHDDQGALAEKNDNGMPFALIADYIEQNL